MDWSNEFYVRLYTRDTTSWRRLGWHGQNALMHLLRKVDRAGTVELDGLEPWEALVLHCAAPEDAAKQGMEAMLRVGVIELRGGLLVFPNFIEAQEASKSDKLRAKESRLRKARGEARSSQNVTAPSQDVMPASRDDPPRHEPSQPVTPRHSSLRSADPSLHSASLRTDTESVRADASGAEPPAADPQPGYDALADGERSSFATKVWTKFRNLHLKRFDLDPSMGGRNVGDFPERLATTAKKRGVDASALLEQTFDLWAAAGRPGCDKATPYSAFVARFDSLVAPSKASGAGRLGYLPPAGADKFANVDPAENLRKCGLSEEEIAAALEELGHGQKPAQTPAGVPAPANTNNGTQTRSPAREGRLAPEGHR